MRKARKKRVAGLMIEMFGTEEPEQFEVVVSAHYDGSEMLTDRQAIEMLEQALAMIRLRMQSAS